MRPAIAQYYPGDSLMHRLDPRWIGGVGGALAFCFGVTYAVAAAGIAL